MVNKDQTAVFFETIYALGSGQLPSGVGVIRISGPKTRAIVADIAGNIPEPRHAELRTLTYRGEVLDRALVLFFPGPASFTGEDTAEFHVHGGPAVVRAVLDAVGSFDNCRHAHAGEFTQRAFLNGKVDLTGAESLADLVSAETEAQRRFAQSGASGVYKSLYTDWQARITRARALIEAELDFSDEQDVPGSVSAQVFGDLQGLLHDIAAHMERSHTGEIVRDGFKVVLVGSPNAGKSSLLNCLAKRDVAIVTEEAGTTRDLIDVALDIGGYKVVVTDTAGLRASENKAESIGVQRAIERSRDADLILHLVDVTAVRGSGLPFDARDKIVVGTKADLGGNTDSRLGFNIVTSSKTGDGIPALLEILAKKVATATDGANLLAPARRRHVELLQRCRDNLNAALLGKSEALELRAEGLRRAADALGRITGSVDVEDLLDVIFSEFCIGK